MDNGILGDFGVQKECGEAIIGRETRGLERGENEAILKEQGRRVCAGRGEGRRENEGRG